MKTNEYKRVKRSTFAVIFFIDRAKVRKDGFCPIMGRITIDGTAAKFNTGIDVDPDNWDAKSGRAAGRNRNMQDTNCAINNLDAEIKRHYEECLREHGYVTAEILKNLVKGIGVKAHTLLTLFKEHNDEYQKRVGLDRSEESYLTYQRTYAVLEEFINQKYDTEDIPLKQLDKNFIEEFDQYLRIDRRLAKSTVSVNTIYLKKIIRRAVSQGTLLFDPFAAFSPELPDREYKHLRSDELDRVLGTHIADKEVCFARDLFVFSTFTGLCHADISTLAEKHILTQSDGSKWIKKKRVKTGVESNVKLLSIPLMIIDKYKNERIGDKIFNTPNRTTISRLMRKLEQLCDIPHIHFHMARHNFATNEHLVLKYLIARVLSRCLRVMVNG